MKAEHLGADCSNCPLRDAPMVMSLIPYNVPEGRRLVVVGEAPGFHETTYGKPFTGPSGKLITEVLAHHKIKRSEVMFTNACLCRPKDNATPDRSAVAACKPRLANEIRDFGATDVLALGATAGTLLVDDPGTITTLRVGGAKHPARFLVNNGVSPDLRVVPTWHPAYCLRNADAFPSLVNDVGKLYNTKYRTWVEPEFVIVDEEEQALYFIDRLQTSEGFENPIEHLVVDIETGLDKDVDFDHPNNYDLLCVGIAYAYNAAVVIGENALKFDSVIQALKRLFKSKKLVAHNGKFDLGGLFPKLGALELWFDTMLAHYTLDERGGGHGLKVLAVEKLGAPAYDDEIKKYVPRRGNYADIPRPILYKYNAYDVACTWALFEMFEEDMDRLGVRHVHDFMVAAANQLMFLELNGIAIDREYSNKLMADYLARLEVIEAEMDEIVTSSTGHLNVPKTGINPRSPKQVKEYLESQGVKVASTNADTLEALFPRLREGTARQRFVATLLRYRREHKLYSTYIVGIRKRMYRGRVYTTYLLHGTTSGRLASRNPNLQNIVRSKEIRRQFSVTHPGNVLIQCDYKQAEARVMATLAQDQYLRNILSRDEEGYDFFNELSDQLYGVGQWAKEERIRTKAFFYGIGYGRESYSIAMEYGLSPSEGAKLYNGFTGLLPGVMQWQEDIKKLVLSGRPLVSPFGRRRHFFLITDQNKKEVFNEALSYLPQSTASDICLRALVRVRPMLRGLGFIRLTIHDALVAECAEERQDEVGQLLSSVMAEEGRKFTDYVPFPVDLSVGKSWGDL
jgi:uracil-DNA glycosylase family 4